MRWTTLYRTKELAEWMDQWDKMAKDQDYDKLLWGYGGPILVDDHVKIQRMPFITPEILASPAHAMPYELLKAIDDWTWNKVRSGKRMRITDPEGTDIEFTNHDSCYDRHRPELQLGPDPADLVRQPTLRKKPICPATSRGDRESSYQGKGRQRCHRPATNHIAPVDWTQLIIADSKVVQINEGGEFGDKLRALMAETADVQYPGMPGPGLMHWWKPPSAPTRTFTDPEGLSIRLRQLSLRTGTLRRHPHRVQAQSSPPWMNAALQEKERGVHWHLHLSDLHGGQ